MRNSATLAFLLLALFGSPAFGTTVTNTAHVEVSALIGGTDAAATLLAKTKVTSVNQEHLSKPLRIVGRLFSESSCNVLGGCCIFQVGQPCDGSAFITQEGQELTCTKAAVGSCLHYWDGSTDGWVDASPPVISFTAKDICKNDGCNNTCPPGQQCDPWDDQ